MNALEIIQSGEASGKAASPDLALEYLLGSSNVRRRLHRALCAAGISEAAKATYETYCYEWGVLSFLNGHIDEHGDVRVWPRRREVCAVRGISERTYPRHMKELEEAGVVRREDGQGGIPSIYLRPAERLLEHLMSLTRVRRVLEERFPEEFDDKVRPLSSLVWERAVSGTPGAAAANPSNTEGEVIRETFASIVQRERERTEKVRQERLNRPAAVKMGGGKKARRKEKNEDTPFQMMELLRKGIKAGLSSVYQPENSQKHRAQMKQLIEAHGAENVRKVIEWVTQPDNWNQFARRCNVTSRVPTPGLLVGFAPSLFPMALENPSGVRRSGGAAPVDVDTSGDENDFV